MPDDSTVQSQIPSRSPLRWADVMTAPDRRWRAVYPRPPAPARPPFPLPWHVPADPYESYEGYLRATHQDLQAMDSPALRKEARRMVWLLDMHETPLPWAEARLAAVRDELRQRRQGGAV